LIIVKRNDKARRKGVAHEKKKYTRKGPGESKYPDQHVARRRGKKKRCVGVGD